MTEEEYIRHEVELRVQSNEISHLKNKFNTIIGLIIGSAIIPIALHFLKLS